MNCNTQLILLNKFHVILFLLCMLPILLSEKLTKLRIVKLYYTEKEEEEEEEKHSVIRLS